MFNHFWPPASHCSEDSMHISNFFKNCYSRDTDNGQPQKGLLGCPFIVTAFPSCPPEPQAATNVFPISGSLPFQECYINGIAQCVTVTDSLFFFSLSESLEVRPGCGMNPLLVAFHRRVVFRGMNVPQGVCGPLKAM